jgi:hypothetical protein
MRWQLSSIHWVNYRRSVRTGFKGAFSTIDAGRLIYFHATLLRSGGECIGTGPNEDADRINQLVLATGTRAK